MTTSEIRKAYLDYFQNEKHAVLPSASLLPENDPTTLFTGSGMQPMVPFLLGAEHPQGTRLADSQKCFRSQDIEEVGDNRHTTFFEMLGNWSLGDYFKKDQIAWMYDFLVNKLGLDQNNLYITCFRGNEDLGIARDHASAELWQQQFVASGTSADIADFSERDGMQGGRIFYYDETKNWWSRAGVPGNMPVGEPGGPDTEMFWDFGKNLGLHEISKWKSDECHVNCDCGRFLEIGNNVFMEYLKTETGFVSLPKQNVDFGGGLERIAAALNGNPDVFMVDLFDGARLKLEELSGKKYTPETKGQVDRAGDLYEVKDGDTWVGEKYDKETRYPFRVILDHIRAAMFLIADGAVPSNKDQGYFTRRLIRRAVRYAKQLGIEQNFCVEIAHEFGRVYAEAYSQLPEKKEIIVSELKKEEEKFRRTLENGLKELRKMSNGQFNKMDDLGNVVESGGLDISGENLFHIYSTYGFPVEMSLEELEKLTADLQLAYPRTPSIDTNKLLKEFNAENKKHQELSRAGADKKFKGGLADHSEMSVKYHTATHLLHAATLKVLGEHAVQKGSNITPERLRFDFAHPEKLTDEQKKEIEDLVNAAIAHDYPVSFAMMSMEEAKAKGAIGLFEDQYGNQVKVYTVGDPEGMADADPSADTFSREFCGGPHVEHTGALGHFEIKKEKSVGAGMRRIRAILT